MIKHVVAFRFEENVPSEVVSDVLAELEALPLVYPSMQRWVLGPNISTRDDSMSHAFVVEFEDEPALLAYLHSDRHETFVRERWRPLIAQQTIVSLEL